MPSGRKQAPGADSLPKMAARKGAGTGAAAGRRAGEADTGRSKGVNTFANDGSFMELFKKKMEEEERLRRRRDEEEEEEEEGGGEEGDGGRVNTEGRDRSSASTPSPATGPDRKRSVLNMVGRRRGGGARLALKTGMVAKKHKAEDEGESGEGDAWAKYMAEVKKYKAHQCSDDDKTRPLVK